MSKLTSKLTDSFRLRHPDVYRELNARNVFGHSLIWYIDRVHEQDELIAELKKDLAEVTQCPGQLIVVLGNPEFKREAYPHPPYASFATPPVMGPWTITIDEDGWNILKCATPKGHKGRHSNGNYTWPEL